MISTAGKEEEYTHGVVIVAVGAGESRPAEYLFGLDERVVTQSEFEERLALHPEEIRTIGTSS